MEAELIYDERELMAPGQIMEKLRAEEFIRPELAPYGDSVITDARVYPTSSSQRYRRTNRLRANWDAETVNPMGARVSNLVEYSGFVMGQRQPTAWRYGWKRIAKIMTDKMDLWIAEMEIKAFRLWERGK